MSHWYGSLAVNLLRSTVTNKYGLTTPLDSDGTSHLNLSKVKLGGCHSKDIGGGRHGGYEFDNEDTGSRCIGETNTRKHEVSECTTLWLGYFIDTIGGEGMVNGSKLVELLSGEPR
eukprot:990734_1